MRVRIRSIVVCFCLLGCGSGSPDKEFTLSLVVLHDTRFGEPAVTYEIRSDSIGIVEDGEVPLIFSGGSIPPAQSWEVVTALPVGDDYEVALTASLEETFVGCTGAADFSVPPRQLGVFLDCRADPTGPPAGIELGPALLYIDGDLRVE